MGDEGIAELILSVGLIICIPLALLLSPVILRSACYLCGVEPPAFVRAWWVSLLTLVLCPLLGAVLSALTRYVGSRLGRSILISVAIAQPPDVVYGWPQIGNALLYSVRAISGADLEFPPGPLFAGLNTESPGVEVVKAEATISLPGSIINLNIIMLVVAAIYNRFLGLEFSRAIVVWLTDLFIKFELIGFIVLMCLAVVRMIGGIR
jgi:hypothetical protein